MPVANVVSSFLGGLDTLGLVISFVCWLLIVVSAFNDSMLKGFLCLFCFLYGFWYAFFEFKHKWKWVIVIGSFACMFYVRHFIRSHL